jgi:hypothetical protein
MFAKNHFTTFLALLAIVVTCHTNAELTTCNLATESPEATLCNIKDLSEPTYTRIVSSILFKIEANDLLWANKYQPVEARWSKLCPSSLCANDCDQDGFCRVGNDLHLVDNLIASTRGKFKFEAGTHTLLLNRDG